jgi:2-hydroxycyclohexanecarboxyl-CoA dehydrogenase
MAGLRERSAFVTGAGSGIGRAIACRLAADGAQVAVADIDLAGARETEATIRAAGGTACALEVDVADFAAVLVAVGAASAAHGPVDVLINNAGWDRIEPFVDNTPAFWERVIGINLKGPIHCCRAVIDGMIDAGRGTIVSISSDAARVGSLGEAVYSACKGGVISFSKTLAREWARHRITVNVVCPGPTDTRLLDEVRRSEQGAKIIAAMTRATPLGRLGTPDDVAAAVAFFASPAAEFITGQVLSVSGGLTMAG